ncbi:hypothetical protein [Glycomyces tarimensis]
MTHLDHDTVPCGFGTERIGVSRVSARRYLEHLCDRGKADVALNYSGRGRPERRYRWQ